MADCSKRLVCEICKKTFCNNSNLKVHVKKIHHDEVYLKSLQLHDKKEYQFCCDVCNKRFSLKRNLSFHRKKHGEEAANNRANNIRNNNNCSLCNNFCGSKSSVLNHYKVFHDILVEEKQIVFENKNEFVTWKDNFENKSNSKYVRETAKSCKNHKYLSLICHRSGKYLPVGKGLRHLKTQGSNKINGFCPASIKIKEFCNGKCEVVLINTHVGHDNNIGHLTLTKFEREKLAAKIAAKIPFEDILDEVRESVCDMDLKRLHLLTNKDLYNIEKCYNLTSTRHSNDAISVESWINSMRDKGNAILFYKPQGNISEEWPLLEEKDFVLIIMTEAQSEMLRKYGSDCICIDGTHGTNSYDFQLITLLIVDDIRQGFPCSFLISNRCDKELLKIFLHYVKINIGTSIQPKVFMTDMAESFFNAWLEVMLPPKFR